MLNTRQVKAFLNMLFGHHAIGATNEAEVDVANSPSFLAGYSALFGEDNHPTSYLISRVADGYDYPEGRQSLERAAVFFRDLSEVLSREVELGAKRREIRYELLKKSTLGFVNREELLAAWSEAGVEPEKE